MRDKETNKIKRKIEAVFIKTKKDIKLKSRFKSFQVKLDHAYKYMLTL